MKQEEENHKHPSYGQIRFSRVSYGGGINNKNHFYGSELQQDHFITMTVQQSEVRRDLSKEWYFASGLPLIEVRMTSNQFAELLTSMNHGSGVPCTIEWVGQKQVEPHQPLESRKEFVHRKFQDRMSDFAETIKDKQAKAKEIVKKKTLSKQDIHDLTLHIAWLSQEIESNIPYFMRKFQETADEVVNEAKAEVENAIQHKINVLGLEKLHEQNKLLK